MRLCPSNCRNEVVTGHFSAYYIAGLHNNHCSLAGSRRGFYERERSPRCEGLVLQSNTRSRQTPAASPWRSPSMTGQRTCQWSGGSTTFSEQEHTL